MGRIGILVLAFCLVIPSIPQVTAQINFAAPERNGEDLFLLAPRAMARLLSEAEAAFAEQRYADGIGALYALLQDDRSELPVDLRGQDYFLGHPANSHYRESAKTKAARLLGQLDSNGRESLELQYGVTARQELDEAISQRNIVQLHAVVRNFPHTLACYDAMVLVAEHATRNGELLAAAMYYDALIQAPAARSRFGVELARLTALSWYQSGRTDLAEKAMAQAAIFFPDKSLEFNGRQLDLSETSHWEAILQAAVRDLPSKNPAQVANWPTTGGNNSRNAVSQIGLPIRTARWDREIHASMLERRALDEVQEMQSRNGNVLLPKFELRMIDDLAITKTTDATVLAIDFASGNIRWAIFLANPGVPHPLTQTTFGSEFQEAASGLSKEIQDRVWGKSSYGQFTCDMERIYVVVDGRQENDFRAQMSAPANELVAAGVQTEGALVWKVGGETGGAEPRLAGSYFLGPPLEEQGVLYCLVERKGQVELVALEAASGRQLWSQQVVYAMFPPLGMDPLRRSQALSPTISQGVILCPTGVGGVVAIDKVTRRLLWANMYDEARAQAFRPQRSGLIGGREYLPLESRWQDPSVMVQDGLAIYTPPDSDQIVVRDIVTGDKYMETRRRGQARYVAGLRDGKLVLVSDSRVLWFRLKDGKLTTGPAFPEGRALAGKGIWQGDTMLLPLSSNTIAMVSTEDGRLLDAAEVEFPVGNLFPYKQQLLSVTPTSVTNYYTRSALASQLRRRKPDEPPSKAELRVEAQLALADGDRETGLERLQQAYELDSQDAETRYLLVETLLDGLETDFERYGKTAQEYAEIFEMGPHRFRFLQQLVLGNIRSGEHLQAFDGLLELMRDRVGSDFSVSRSRRSTLSIEKGYRVDSDTWIATNLSRTYELADPSMRAVMEDRIARELAELERSVLSVRRQKLRFLAWLPAAGEALLRLAEALGGGDEQTVAERVVAPLLVSGVPDLVSAAKQFLGKLTETDKEFFGPFGSVNRLRGFRVDEADGEDLQSVLDGLVAMAGDQPQWKSGMVVETVVNQRDYQQGVIVPQKSERFGRPALRVAVDEGQLLIYNSVGQVVGRPRFDRATSDTSTGILRVSFHGGLIIVETLSEVAAFDLYRGMANGNDALLWRYSLLNPSSAPLARSQPPGTAQIELGVGITRIRRVMLDKLPAVVGPVTEAGIPVLVGRELSMLDLLTGRVIWSREEIIGDVSFAVQGNELAVVTDQTGKDGAIRVFDCRDGAEIRQIEPLGRWNRWFSYQGLLVDCEDDIAGSSNGLERGVILHVWNPLQQREVAKWRLPAGSRVAECEQRFLVAIAPDGNYFFLDLDKAQDATQMQQDPVGKVEVDTLLDGITIERFNDQLIVLSNASGRGEELRAADLFDTDAPQRDLIPVHGYVYALDTVNGDLAWQRAGRAINMWFPTMQPRSAPYMVLFRISPVTRLGSLALIDRRDGTIAYAFRGLPYKTESGFAMSVSPLSQAISIDLGIRGYRFVVTDLPEPPEPVFFFRP